MGIPRAISRGVPKSFPEANLDAFLQSIPRSPFFHSPIWVLIIAFYYLFTNVLFTTHYSKYMAYKNKIIGMGRII